MNRRTILLSAIFLTLSLLLSQEISAGFSIDFQLYADESYENNDVYDINGDLCSIIKLYYDYETGQEINLLDVQVHKRVPHKDKNVIDFYVAHWSKSITISTKGVELYRYNLPENLKPGKCYSMGVKVPSKFYNGSIQVTPNPTDSEIKLIDETGKEYYKYGAVKFDNLKPGMYRIKAEHPDCISKELEFTLQPCEEKIVPILLPNTKLYFKLEIPDFMLETIEVEVSRSSSFAKADLVEYLTMGRKIVIGEAGKYYFRLKKSGRELFRDEVSLFLENAPAVLLNYQAYYAPLDDCELKVNGEFYDKGKELYLISSHKSESVELVIPGYSGLQFTENFEDEDHKRELQLGEDFFSSGFGIGLKSNESKVFYGVKLPIFYSPSFYSMTGIEINIWNAGNRTKKTSGGSFTGLSLAGFSVTTDNDMTGLAIGGILTNSGGSLNGVSAGGLLVSSHGDMNGVSFGSLNITGGKVNGVQFGIINFAGDLKGIQIGLINMIDDGKGGGLPVMPLFNVKF